jgi:hypothetical protein
MKVTLEHLEGLGFDRSSQWPGTHRFAVACSCCHALVVNGTPTHESGCPNAMHECNGCNVLVPVRQRYCADCA